MSTLEGVRRAAQSADDVVESDASVTLASLLARIIAASVAANPSTAVSSATFSRVATAGRAGTLDGLPASAAVAREADERRSGS